MTSRIKLVKITKSYKPSYRYQAIFYDIPSDTSRSYHFGDVNIKYYVDDGDPNNRAEWIEKRIEELKKPVINEMTLEYWILQGKSVRIQENVDFYRNTALNKILNCYPNLTL